MGTSSKKNVPYQYPPEACYPLTERQCDTSLSAVKDACPLGSASSNAACQDNTPLSMECACRTAYGNNYIRCGTANSVGLQCCGQNELCSDKYNPDKATCCDKQTLEGGGRTTREGGYNWCTANKKLCESNGNKFCKGGSRSSCCPSSFGCSSFAFKNVGLCRDPNCKEENKCRRQGNDNYLCCKDNEKCNDFGSWGEVVPSCVAQYCPNPPYDDKLCEGKGENSKYKICCLVGQLCVLAPNGYPRCVVPFT